MVSSKMGKRVNGKHCEICNESFSMNDLYPIALVRSNVIQAYIKANPKINIEGFICYPDLRNIHAEHYQQVLERERGVLSDLEQEVIDSIKEQELLSENINLQFEESLSFGDHLADKMAEFGGSWTFISLFGVMLVIWVLLNTTLFFLNPIDPYPYIFLNLILSCIAAIQAPVIMMSQNRQAAKDRLNIENDYVVNLKAELQIRQTNARLELFMKYHWQKMIELQRFQEEILQELDDLPHKKQKRP